MSIRETYAKSKIAACGAFWIGDFSGSSDPKTPPFCDFLAHGTCFNSCVTGVSWRLMVETWGLSLWPFLVTFGPLGPILGPISGCGWSISIQIFVRSNEFMSYLRQN